MRASPAQRPTTLFYCCWETNSSHGARYPKVAPPITTVSLLVLGMLLLLRLRLQVGLAEMESGRKEQMNGEVAEKPSVREWNGAIAREC